MDPKHIFFKLSKLWDNLHLFKTYLDFYLNVAIHVKVFARITQAAVLN